MAWEVGGGLRKEKGGKAGWAVSRPVQWGNGPDDLGRGGWAESASRAEIKEEMEINFKLISKLKIGLENE
jgi:hypothetical protein